MSTEEPEPAAAHVVDATASAIAPQSAVAQPVVAEEAVAEDAMSPMAQLNQELSSMNLFEGKTKEQIVGIRQLVEAGLQAFNTIKDACQIIRDAIMGIAEIKANEVRFNPEIGHLSDFVDHCKLLISINDGTAAAESVSVSVKATLETLKEYSRFKNDSYKLTIDQAKIGGIGTQISLVLRIGAVFNVPVFTVYVLQNVFDNANLNSEPQTIVASPLRHNLKTIATCSRVDLMLELLLHATQSDPYDQVNVLIAHVINESIVSKFKDTNPNPNPNEVIASERAHLFDLLIADNEHVKSLITKALLIAIIQNPGVMTPDGKRFFDMFPSGQYGKYLGEIVHKATLDPRDQGPILLPNVSNEQRVEDGVGEAPGLDEAEPLRHRSHPLTRTDIIVAALTAVNNAMGRDANIIAAGGAAVSYYIADFVRGMHNGDFERVIAESGLDVDALDSLEKGCAGIPMNDIDCFVFGDVSRQFLMLFSLYMMILYANFYERPKQYGVEEAVRGQDTPIQFKLSPQSDENIGLFMYGEHNADANTRLISKTLKKNPKVQLVTQETKCFSQLSSTLCDGGLCTVDGYYTQPIDLVKKEINDFLVLYESLYPKDEDNPKPDLIARLTSQYAANVDNMVSMKTTMLDLVCIFCNEDKALFIRIFMARKNHKDFARLRVFIEIYLLELLRKKDAAFLEHKAALIGEIKELRTMMQALTAKYYSEQGNIAAVHAATAKELNADRAAFLTLLRSIGRKIVLIPDPLNDVVPATFRKETGRKTISFFKDRQNEQIKYPFKMDQDMFNLYETYMVSHAYDGWLNKVFQEMPFIPKVEEAFREKMGQIIDKTQDPMYFEVGFSNMIVRSPEMLRLFTLLNQVKVSDDDDMFKKGSPKRKFTGKLLNPLRQSILRSSGIKPKATGVLKLYNPESKATIPEFASSVIKDPALLETINRPDEYDDAVNEAIGRIILEWDKVAPKGGATRKRKRERVCKLTTRRFNKCVRRRATHKANNKHARNKHMRNKHKHTRRT